MRGLADTMKVVCVPNAVGESSRTTTLVLIKIRSAEREAGEMFSVFSSALGNQLDDDRDEFNPFVPLAVVLVLFIISGVLSFNEFRYAVWGRSAGAEIYRLKETAFSAGEGKGTMVAVRYRWTDKDDGVREDALLFDPDKDFSEGGVIEIEYLPGVKKSRIAGTPIYASVAIGFFVVLGGAALVLFVILWRQGTRRK